MGYKSTSSMDCLRAAPPCALSAASRPGVDQVTIEFYIVEVINVQFTRDPIKVGR